MRDGLTALLHNPDLSWLAHCFSLLFLPFAHEDLAIILGAYIVANKIMSVGLVALCIYSGMVVSDFALYAVGAGARRLPWLARIAVDDRVRGFGDVLKRNLFGIVALCRAVPGIVFVAFIACGWMRVPLARFVVASLSVSALYLPLMLCVVVFFGVALDERMGLWTWPALLIVLMALEVVRRRVFGFADAAQPAAAEQAERGAPSPLSAEPEPLSVCNRQWPHGDPRHGGALRGTPATPTGSSDPAGAPLGAAVRSRRR